jgi:hypothetical protein
MDKKQAILPKESGVIITLSPKLKLEIEQSKKEIENGCFLEQSTLDKMVRKWAKVK